MGIPPSQKIVPKVIQGSMFKKSSSNIVYLESLGSPRISVAVVLSIVR